MHLYFSLYGQQLCVSAQAFTIHVKVARFQIRRLSRRHLSFPPSKSVGIFFMVPCISFYNLIQRSRRVIHIRHHATDIDEVTVRRAVTGGICLYLTAQLCDILIFNRLMDMPVEHERCRSEAGTEEGNRIMTHHNMLAAVLDFLQVRNFLEHTLCGSAELLGIVIAPYQHLVAAKRTNNRRPLAFLCPDEIAKNVYRIIAAYSGVPVFYELVIS